MTAIHRRKMLEVILGSAAVAAVGSSVIPVPAESTPYRRRSIVLQALCPAAFTAASSAGGMEGRGEDRESAAGAGSRRMAGSGFRPLSTEGPDGRRQRPRRSAGLCLALTRNFR